MRDINALTEEIRKLADAGLNLAEVAQRLDVAKWQVRALAKLVGIKWCRGYNGRTTNVWAPKPKVRRTIHMAGYHFMVKRDDEKLITHVETQALFDKMVTALGRKLSEAV
jgi:hypothetical protein